MAPDIESSESRKLKDIVQSLAKGFRVLQAFTPQEPQLLLIDLARRAELDSGTTFRLLNTLVMLGYVAKIPGTRKFRLTLKALELGFNAIAQMELSELARPLLRSLVGDVSESAGVGVLDGADVVYVERVQAGRVHLGLDVRLGMRIPAYYSAIGHASLAFLPRQEALSVLNASNRIRLAASIPTTISEIEQRLAQVRRDGFAVSEADVVAGLRILAVPVLDRDGRAIAGLSLAASTQRMPLDEFISATLDAARSAANDLARALAAAGRIAALARAHPQ